MPTGQLAKCQILLTKFDIVYVTRMAMKAQALADHLAENLIDDKYQPLSTYFPYEEVNSIEVIRENINAWKMFFDRAVNTKGIGIGEILILPTEYPDQASGDQKRTIRRLASNIFLSGEILYKRTPDLNMLRCVDSREAERIMNEVHSGVCGTHMSGYVLAKKILRADYYWMTKEKDCFSFARKYHQCQIHSDLIHAPPSELHPMSAPWPFVAWGMNVIMPIDPQLQMGTDSSWLPLIIS
ncbi:uncharacterized protein [Nicotiana tomentosiformis]|uniref:uncharacterized protein n=1 Tax=Nicotiana tomentosiformis TaxID=4098 RepID=UPI00388CAD72